MRAPLARRARDESADTLELQTKIAASVQQNQENLADALQKGFDQLVKAGAWQAAVQLVVKDGGISEAELARSLEVMRSTVNRWLNGETVPAKASIPAMAHKIRAVLRP